MEGEGKLRDDRILPAVRKEIDTIDEQIVELLNRRARVSRRVGRIKAGGSGQIFKPMREKKLLAALAAMSHGSLPVSHLEAIYREIMSSSRALQETQRVAYLGPEGTFSYFAARAFLGSSAEYTPKPGFEQIFAAVASGEADLGVIPLENSLHGSVGQALDLFVRYPMHMQAEAFFKVNQFLLSQAESLAEVREVISHPQALGQCAAWLAANLPHAELKTCESTAASVRLAAENPQAAGIGSDRLGEMFGVKILAGPIDDAPDNWTRFAFIAREPVRDAENEKTSILFTTKDEPGALAKVLGFLAEHGINMTKLESRPSPTERWRYVFFVDLDLDLTREDQADTVAGLRKVCANFRVLGSYPAGPHLDRLRRNA